MIVGVDFDNTLVCYDGLFHAAGVRNGLLPPEAPTDKRGVRQWLLARDRERDFTLLQGEVYGAAIRDAKPYPGALDCLRELKNRGAAVFIVSHKTRRPVLGAEYDLHAAALAWLAGNYFLAEGMLRQEEVFLEATQEDKARRVALLGCTHFIDDMRAFLLHPLFPAATEKLWFRPPGEPAAPDSAADADSGLAAFSSWRDIGRRLLTGNGTARLEHWPH